MSRYETLLFLHLLSAFALVTAEVLFTFLIVALWKRDVPSEVASLFRLSRLGDVLVAVGSLGVLAFGIWLAVDVEGYHLWSGWIVAAFVLWVLFGAAGNRTGKVYYAARDRARVLVAEGRNAPNPELKAIMRSPAGLVLHTLSVAILVLFLVDMIFKPGA